MNLKYFFLLIVISGVIFFYSRQQVEIIQMQYRIKEIYDSISSIEAENAMIFSEIENLKSYKKLEEFAVRNGFVKPTKDDIMVIYLDN